MGESVLEAFDWALAVSAAALSVGIMTGLLVGSVVVWRERRGQRND